MGKPRANDDSVVHVVTAASGAGQGYGSCTTATCRACSRETGLEWLGVFECGRYSARPRVESGMLRTIQARLAASVGVCMCMGVYVRVPEATLPSLLID